MTTKRLNVGITSVQSVRPDYRYGSSLPHVPIRASAATPLLNIAGIASLPKNAVITSAKVWINQSDGPWSGSNTLTLMRHLTPFTWQVTWNTRPAATTSANQTKTGSAAGTWWSIDITPDVQAIVAGTRKNYGWRLATDSGTTHKVRSQEAAANQPYMEVVYQVPSKVPTNLSPQGGTVSTGSPVLTFSTGDDTVSVQVQVDPLTDDPPEFDTDEIDATAGVVDLSETFPGGTYAGLADGDTTYWRARAKGAAGWSNWSQWVSFSRADLGTADLTSPVATPADGTPPFEWTFTETQTSWQATLLDAAGRVLDDSGLVSGTDTAWTPSRGLTATGQSGTARIRLYDDVTDRIATSGSPTYAEDTVDFTVTFDGTVDPLDTLTATQTSGVPGVNLEGTRAAGVPDEVAIFRDDVQVARLPGTDVFDGTDFAWTDWTAPMNRETVYRVAPIVNNAVASTGPTVEVTPKCRGLWLIEPVSGQAIVLWGAVKGSFEGGDIATVHRPVAGPPVRRRLSGGVLTGVETGQVLDTDVISADDVLAAFEAFDLNDAGTRYRLVDGHVNLEVIAGDFILTPTPQSGVELIADGQFAFWSQ